MGLTALRLHDDVDAILGGLDANSLGVDNAREPGVVQLLQVTALLQDVVKNKTKKERISEHGARRR